MITAILTVGATLLRIGVDGPVDTPLPERLIPVLIATALLLGALLALPRSAGVAWALLTASSGLSTFEIVAVVRALAPNAVDAGSDLTLVAGSALIGASGIAVAFAARPRAVASTLTRIAVAIAWTGVAATVLASIWAVGEAGGAVAAFGGVPTSRIASRLALATWVGGVIVGAARDLVPPAFRAARRSSDEPVRGGRLFRYLRLFADELVPSRGARRREIAEAERARLAADLHALVLPDLRRAASAAEAAGASEAMQLDLRRALEDVEHLMHERQSIVLEQFGLVAALEWLAERTEERSPLRVELEIDGDVPEGPNAIDPTVARAAFRIALLALDNVVRHAGASTASLRLAVDGNGLSLSVGDDGRVGVGFESSAGRGLSDMRAEASGSGGSIDISTEAGAQVHASWPRRWIAGNHASRPANLADRSSPSAP